MSGNSTSERSRIKVFARCRPPNEAELNDPHFVNCVELFPKDKKIRFAKSAYEDKEFVFDEVFGPDSTQEQVFRAVAEDVVNDAFLGYHGTLFVYGQTGTGKTHTMCSRQENNEGIMPRCIRMIFDRVAMDSIYEYTIRMNYIQIYMEMIQDLLSPENNNLQIRQDADTGVYISGVHSQCITSVEQFFHYYEEGDSNRTTALTKMNAQSSRSHACLIINIERRLKFKAEDFEASIEDRKVLHGKIFLVDLAGSERIKKTGATGMRQEEAKAINLSLTTLGTVIHKLTEKKTSHIPYRDSKLTRLLQDSLGGHGKTAIIVTIGPSAEHWQETHSTLLFGQRAMRVKIQATVHEEIDYKALSIKLQAELDEAENLALSLENDKKSLSEEIEALNLKLKESQDANSELTQKIELLKLDHAQEKESLISLLEGDIQEAEEQHAAALAQLNQRIESLREAHKKEIADLKAEHSKLMEEAELEFIRNVEELEDTIKANEATIEENNKKINDQANIIASMSHQMNALEKETTQRIAELTEERDMLQHELEELRNDSMATRDLLSAQKSAVQSELASTNKALEESQRELNDAKQQLTLTREEIAKLERDLAHANDTISERDTKIKQLEAHLREKTAQLEKALQELSRTTDELLAMRTALDQTSALHQQAMAELRAALSTREAELAETRSRVESLTVELASASANLTSASDEFASSYEIARNEISRLESELAISTNSLTKLQAELSATTNSLSDLRSELSSKSEQLQACEATIVSLKHQIQTQNQVHQQKEEEYQRVIQQFRVALQEHSETIRNLSMSGNTVEDNTPVQVAPLDAVNDAVEELAEQLQPQPPSEQESLHPPQQQQRQHEEPHETEASVLPDAPKLNGTIVQSKDGPQEDGSAVATESEQPQKREAGFATVARVVPVETPTNSSKPTGIPMLSVNSSTPVLDSSSNNGSANSLTASITSELKQTIRYLTQTVHQLRDELEQTDKAYLAAKVDLSVKNALVNNLSYHLNATRRTLAKKEALLESYKCSVNALYSRLLSVHHMHVSPQVDAEDSIEEEIIKNESECYGNYLDLLLFTTTTDKEHVTPSSPTPEETEGSSNGVAAGAHHDDGHENTILSLFLSIFNRNETLSTVPLLGGEGKGSTVSTRAPALTDIIYSTEGELFKLFRGVITSAVSMFSSSVPFDQLHQIDHISLFNSIISSSLPVLANVTHSMLRKDDASMHAERGKIPSEWVDTLSSNFVVRPSSTTTTTTTTRNSLNNNTSNGEDDGNCASTVTNHDDAVGELGPILDMVRSHIQSGGSVPNDLAASEVQAYQSNLIKLFKARYLHTKIDKDNKVLESFASKWRQLYSIVEEGENVEGDDSDNDDDQIPSSSKNRHSVEQSARITNEFISLCILLSVYLVHTKHSRAEASAAASAINSENSHRHHHHHQQQQQQQQEEQSIDSLMRLVDHPAECPRDSEDDENICCVRPSPPPPPLRYYTFTRLLDDLETNLYSRSTRTRLLEMRIAKGALVFRTLVNMYQQQEAKRLFYQHACGHYFGLLRACTLLINESQFECAMLSDALHKATVELYSTSIQFKTEKQLQEQYAARERAARVIQRYYRKIRTRALYRQQWLTTIRLEKERQEQERKLKEYKAILESRDAKTGYLLMNKSLSEIETIFRILMIYFDPFSKEDEEEEGGSASSPVLPAPSGQQHQHQHQHQHLQGSPRRKTGNNNNSGSSGSSGGGGDSASVASNDNTSVISEPSGGGGGGGGGGAHVSRQKRAATNMSSFGKAPSQFNLVVQAGAPSSPSSSSGGQLSPSSPLSSSHHHYHHPRPSVFGHFLRQPSSSSLTTPLSSSPATPVSPSSSSSPLSAAAAAAESSKKKTADQQR